MEQFAPKHFSYSTNKPYDLHKDFIFISEFGNIIVSKSLKIKLIEEPKNYTILYDNANITYSDLILINTAVSVVNTTISFIILLDNGKLLYVVKYEKLETNIKEFNTKIKDINIEYLGYSDQVVQFSLFTNNTLYLITQKTFEFVIFQNVVGYFYYNNYLLLVDTDNIINCINIFSSCKAPIIKSKYDKLTGKYSVNYKVLDVVNISEIKFITMFGDTIIAIYNNGNMEYYTSGSSTSFWYPKIKDLIGIARIESIHDTLICSMDDMRVILYNKHDMEFIEYHDIERYLFDSIGIVGVHVNGSIEMLYGEIFADNWFLNNMDKTLSKIIFYSSENVIVYVTIDNRVISRNMLDDLACNLNDILDIEHLGLSIILTELQLKDYKIGSYI